MKARVIAALLAAVFLAPAQARAAGAIAEARGASADPLAFDGARAHPEGDAVRAGSTGDKRPALTAADQRVDGGERRAASTLGADKEIEAPKPNPWLSEDRIITGAVGAMTGALIGSMWGLPGLLIGLLVGALVGYAVAALKS